MDSNKLMHPSASRPIGQPEEKSPNAPSITELLDSWEPLGDEDAMPEIDDLTPEPFDL
jgi:hypothetical protein